MKCHVMLFFIFSTAQQPASASILCIETRVTGVVTPTGLLRCRGERGRYGGASLITVI